jgi:hypothetical protein
VAEEPKLVTVLQTLEVEVEVAVTIQVGAARVAAVSSY